MQVSKVSNSLESWEIVPFSRTQSSLRQNATILNTMGHFNTRICKKIL